MVSKPEADPLHVASEMETLPKQVLPQMDPTWTTHDRRRLKVSEMTDDHVHNARNWALRTARRLDAWALNAYTYAKDAPDGASMAAEEAAGQFLERAQNLRNWADHFSRTLNQRERARGDRG